MPEAIDLDWDLDGIGNSKFKRILGCFGDRNDRKELLSALIAGVSGGSIFECGIVCIVFALTDGVGDFIVGFAAVA